MKGDPMKKVTITFEGKRAEEMAGKFFSYLVDGGLEDTVIDHLSDATTDVGIGECDADKLTVRFDCKPRYSGA